MHPDLNDMWEEKERERDERTHEKDKERKKEKKRQSEKKKIRKHDTESRFHKLLRSFVNVYVMSAHMFVNRTILPGRIIIRVKLQYNKYVSACI